MTFEPAVTESGAETFTEAGTRLVAAHPASVALRTTKANAIIPTVMPVGQLHRSFITATLPRCVAPVRIFTKAAGPAGDERVDAYPVHFQDLPTPGAVGNLDLEF